jgi:hypothetical protein
MNPHEMHVGTREIVTVIECIPADGRVIPMYIYNGGKNLLG